MILISFSDIVAVKLLREKNRMLEEQYQKGVEQFPKMVGTDKIDELREQFRSLISRF